MDRGDRSVGSRKENGGDRSGLRDRNWHRVTQRSVIELRIERRVLRGTAVAASPHIADATNSGVRNRRSRTSRLRIMKTSSLLHLFASAMALAATGCGSSSGPRCVDHPSTVTLSIDGGATVDGGAGGGLDCLALCGSNFCDLSFDGKAVTCHTDCTGRRPQGLDGSDAPSTSCTLGGYFAEVMCLEAASVNAFRILTEELVRFGAPRRLVQAARRAKRDEKRHVRLTLALARRFGATPRRPRIDPPRTRKLLDIAIENAVEGCVRETFGALIAHWQAAHAQDPQVRAAMTHIARDETRHSALAWQTHVWMRSRLTSTERQRVAEAMQKAARELSERHVEPPAALARGAGMPGNAASKSLAAFLNQQLWQSS